MVDSRMSRISDAGMELKALDFTEGSVTVLLSSTQARIEELHNHVKGLL
jgi:hypothetical protein